MTCRLPDATTLVAFAGIVVVASFILVFACVIYDLLRRKRRTGAGT